jgi:glycosyltransferase involved in cell wall biosynthesis
MTPDRPIKILQLSYGSSLYGAERWVLTLIKHLDPGRVETVVGCILDGDGSDLPLIDEARRMGLATEVIDARRNMIASSVRGIRAVTRRLGIQVLHTHGSRQDVIASVASLGLPCATLSTPHGWPPGPTRRERVYTVLNKLAYIGFDAVAPLSQDLLDSLRPFPIRKSKIELISNGVDLSEVEAATPAALPWDGSHHGIFTLGYVGRLVAGKGVEVLIEALGMGAGDLDWRCIILGEGPERGRLEAEAARRGLGDRVRFMGYRPDRLSYVKRLDLLVLPSYAEGVPRCLMEGLAAGIPCAGSRIPGIDVVLEDGVTGYTFPAGDAGLLAGIIRQASRERARARELARAGKLLVHERFSAGAMARAYESLYARLVSRGPRHGTVNLPGNPVTSGRGG